jgi:hypothetical protein
MFRFKINGYSRTPFLIICLANNCNCMGAWCNMMMSVDDLSASSMEAINWLFPTYNRQLYNWFLLLVELELYESLLLRCMVSCAGLCIISNMLGDIVVLLLQLLPNMSTKEPAWFGLIYLYHFYAWRGLIVMHHYVYRSTNDNILSFRLDLMICRPLQWSISPANYCTLLIGYWSGQYHRSCSCRLSTATIDPRQPHHGGCPALCSCCI